MVDLELGENGQEGESTLSHFEEKGISVGVTTYTKTPIHTSNQI